MNKLELVINEIWPLLMRGDKVSIAAETVEHASCRPDLFVAPKTGAWPAGQCADYVWRLPNGGRIHAQYFNNGCLVRFHLDKYDPDRGIADSLKHLMFETPVGPAIGIAGTVYVVSRIAR